jgi:hypothetical protein
MLRACDPSVWLRALALLIAPFATAPLVAAPVWDGVSLPITIEALRDVFMKTAEHEAHDSQERGALYSTNSLQIAKGERFQMVAVLAEGGCRIEFHGALHELSSCPWLPGFTDTQVGVFRVVTSESR